MINVPDNELALIVERNGSNSTNETADHSTAPPQPLQ
jgi:hypothetical protein